MRIHDAIVVGAGPAGATAALALVRSGRDVAVIEKEAFPRAKVCGEFISAPTWAVLDELGLAARLRAEAGPPVDRVGLYSGRHCVEAPMPRGDAGTRGRAIGRHRLDAALLQAAAEAGAEVRQPATVEDVSRDGEILRVRVGDTTLAARRVIDTHGSWLPGPFGATPPVTAHDLLGFKARFAGASLPRGLMPLVLFPGGYGGLVETDSGETSFSCCIRHGVLRGIRDGGMPAGEALFGHVARHCRGFREALQGSALQGRWLAAGPIRPGFRRLHRDGVFAAGNAAGEAHPLIAEGIAMAIQSGWLLARHLVAAKDDAQAAAGYERDWRRQFALRIRASQAFAALGASATAPAFTAVVRLVPAALTLGAFCSGKVRPLARLEAA